MENNVPRRLTTTEVDEKWASFLLGEVLGAEVQRTDLGGKNGDGRTDLGFTIEGKRGIAEVVSTRDAEVEELSAAMSRHRYTRVEGLRRLWFVEPSTPMRVKGLCESLPDRLRQLEELGIMKVRDQFTREFKLPRELRSIPNCFSIEPSDQHPPGFFLSRPVSAGFPGSGDQALAEAEKFLGLESGKVSKLNSEAARQGEEGRVVDYRYLVVLVDPNSDSSEALFRFLTGTDDPSAFHALELQEGVTGLWFIPMDAFSPVPVLHRTQENDRWMLTRVPVNPETLAAIFE